MNTFVISALSALLLAASLNVASIGAASAQTASCFRGDTMDRDGGPSGRLGSPQCGGNYAQRIVIGTDRAIG
jgi:hypothetical protein